MTGGGPTGCNGGGGMIGDVGDAGLKTLIILALISSKNSIIFFCCKKNQLSTINSLKKLS